MSGIKLFEGTSGRLLVPADPSDPNLVLKWDPTTETWIPGTGGGGGAVDSVFGRTGIVVAEPGDYTDAEVDNTSSVGGSTVRAALNTLLATITALVTGVSSVFGRAGAVVAAANDYTLAQINAAAINNGSTLVKHAGALVGLGSTEATIAATGSRDPGSDKVCELYLSDPVNTNKTLTLSDATGKPVGFTASVYMQQSTGTGRWSVATSVPTTLFTQPDAGAYALDFVWNGTAWGTPAYKPIQNF